MFNSLLLQANAAQQGSPLLTIAFLLVGLGIFYFFMIRPQVQQQKAEDTFASKLKKGKQIVTGGGIHGKIMAVNDKTVDVLIAPKTTITIQKSYISLALTEAAYGENATKKETTKATA